MKTTTIHGRAPTNRLQTLLLSVALLGGLWMAPATQNAEARQFAWEETGGPEIGWTQTIHRHTDGTLLAAGGSGAVYYSTDDGVSWQRSGTGGANHTFQVFTSMPSGNIVAGAGEQGTFRSTDNGRTFEKVGFGTIDVTALMVADDGSLFIGTTGTDDGQIFRSTDEGATGFAIRSFGSDANIWAMAGMDGVYVAAIGGYEGGIAVSTNGGINWTMQSISGQPEGQSVAVDGSGTFYVSVNDWDTKSEGELYRSTDGGSSWDVLDPTPGTETWVQKVFVDGNRVIVTSDLEVLTVSTDGGESFSRPTTQFLPSSQVILRTSGGDLLMTAAPAGMYRSSDDGVTWQPSIDGFVDAYVDALVRAPNGTFYAAANDGLFRSETGLGDWSEPIAGDVFRVIVHPSGTLYTRSNFTANARRSDDGGDSWTTISTPLWSDIDLTTFLGAVPGGELFMSGANFQNGENMLVRSTDNGATWAEITSDINGLEIAVIREMQNGTLLLGTRYPGELYRSTDRGASWSSVTIPEIEYINDIVFHPDGTIFLAGDLGAHRSSDGGSTWTLASGGLPEDINPFFGDGPPYLRSIAVSESGELFGSPPGGLIFHSLDKGATWEPLADQPDGPSFGPVPVLRIFDGRLYAGTGGSGVLRTTGSVVNIERIADELPSETFISRNYPNPFTSQTTVEFGIEQSGPVTLRVYDTLGREVARLADETLQTGVHRIVFDGAGLTAGTYIYRLSTPSGAVSRTMTLLK